MRQIRSKNSNLVKQDQQIHIRISSEDKKILTDKSKERGISFSAYVKEKLLSDENPNIYSKPLSQTLHNITDLLLNKVELHCNDEAFIHECERSANELWHYLK